MSWTKNVGFVQCSDVHNWWIMASTYWKILFFTYSVIWLFLFTKQLDLFKRYLVVNQETIVVTIRKYILSTKLNVCGLYPPNHPHCTKVYISPYTWFCICINKLLHSDSWCHSCITVLFGSRWLHQYQMGISYICLFQHFIFCTVYTGTYNFCQGCSHIT